jgi:hypothetical protein
MRLWSLHPKYLDAKGLVALWREALLAQNVLRGNTKGYKNHPQLNRFKAHANPVAAIGTYLFAVYEEATARGYNFSREKIIELDKNLAQITVTNGQMQYELTHLKRKLETRDPKKLAEISEVTNVAAHPVFKIIEGAVEDWEVV